MINKFIRKYLMRWALKEIIKEQQLISDKYTLQERNDNLLNNWFHFSINQDDLFQKLFDVNHSLKQTKNPPALREFIFYAQGEIEAWCEDNCSGKFYIYFDDYQYLYFMEDSADATLFKLTWM